MFEIIEKSTRLVEITVENCWKIILHFPGNASTVCRWDG